ncbi:MAG TPA: hypothetical protein VD994_11835 [Prosthecobacter sp.]|nr:hypothetical protein [Prosthecobacter sp.]
MPDVGLFTATEPVSPDTKVVIRYSVEVGGLEVYNESYDVEKLAAELKEDEGRVAELWARRIKCVVACRDRPGFSACVTRCLTDGQSCVCGHAECDAVDFTGRPDKG